MKIDKFKAKATLCRENGWRLDVNFHLSPRAEEHSGRETILDVLNSERTFIPLEDLQSNEILFVNKTMMMMLELQERGLTHDSTVTPQVSVQVKLISGKVLAGHFLIELPPEKSRVSDYLNLPFQFFYLAREEGDCILNKFFILSVKDG